MKNDPNLSRLTSSAYAGIKPVNSGLDQHPLPFFYPSRRIKPGRAREDGHPFGWDRLGRMEMAPWVRIALYKAIEWHSKSVVERSGGVGPAFGGSHDKLPLFEVAGIPSTTATKTTIIKKGMILMVSMLDFLICVSLIP